MRALGQFVQRTLSAVGVQAGGGVGKGAVMLGLMHNVRASLAVTNKSSGQYLKTYSMMRAHT